MFSILRALPACPAILLSFAAAASIAQGQTASNISAPPAPRQITGRIDENALTGLPGNVHPMAQARYDRGRVPDSLPQDHILMMLKRSPQQQQALDLFMQDQYNSQSPNFHHWLTPDQFGSLFGPSMSDIGQVSQWLGQHGFSVNRIAPGRTFIDFNGTAGQVAAAFHTEIHYYQVNGEQHYANATEPMIPAALAPLVSGFRALNNFYPQPLSRTPGVARLDRTTGKWSLVAPGGLLTDGSGANAAYLVGPQDFAEIYGLNQAWAQTVSSNGTTQKLVGTGQTIGIVGDTDLNSADIESFRSQFGLNTLGPNGSVVVDHPPSTVCAAPDPSDNDAEGYIDAEWAGATAPDAAIDFVSCADDGNTAGVDLAATYIVEDPTRSAQDSVLSSSYSYCEADPISEPDQFYVALWQQAAAEGITVVVASGDAGSAECDDFTGNPYAVQGLGVNAEASTPYNIAAGGTDFSDLFSGAAADYWAAANGPNLESALSYIPETTWNDSCASPLVLEAFGAGFTSSGGPNGFCTYASQLPNDPNTGFSPYFNHVAGTGGLSDVSARPSWQSGVAGIPGGTARALPDISMFAGDGLTWGHALLFCDSYYLPSGITCDFSNPDNLYDNEDGGTSFVAPAFAGIMALINQKNGGRQGQADTILYPLAAAQYVSGGSSTQPSVANCAAYLGTAALSSCYFHDISGTPNPNPATQAQTPFLFGNISVPCTGSATAAGTYTDASTDPASNSENCYGYQITVTQNGGSLVTAPNYYGVVSTADNAASPAYSAGPGYDLATGLGSPNVAALVGASAWSGLTISPSTLPPAVVGTAYSQTLVATGRVPPYTWSIVSGTLPPGLSLGSSTGVISGTPTASATSSFTVQVADSESTPATAKATFTLAAPGVAVTLSPASLIIPFAGSGTLTITLTPQGGFTGPVTLSCGALPAHISCNFDPSPAVLTANGGAVNDLLTINTVANAAASARPLRMGSGGAGSGIFAAMTLWLPAGLAGFLGFRRRKWRNLSKKQARKQARKRLLCALGLAALLTAGFSGVAAMSGCSGSASNTTPDGAYNIPINVTYAGGSQSASATVHIQ